MKFFKKNPLNPDIPSSNLANSFPNLVDLRFSLTKIFLFFLFVCLKLNYFYSTSIASHICYQISQLLNTKAKLNKKLQTRESPFKVTCLLNSPHFYSFLLFFSKNQSPDSLAKNNNKIFLWTHKIFLFFIFLNHEIELKNQQKNKLVELVKFMRHFLSFFVFFLKKMCDF